MKPKELKSIDSLETGDIIVSKLTGLSYVVTDHYGEYAIAVRTQHVSNPSEWMVFKAGSLAEAQQPPQQESEQ